LKSSLHLNHRRNQNSASSYPSSPSSPSTPWFRATWTFPPGLQYLRNINISRLHEAPLFVWKLHAGVHIRESIKAAVEEFIKMLYVAKSQSQTTAAAAKFIKHINSSSKELRSQNLRQNLFSLETQNQKNIRTHDETPSIRAASLTYRDGEAPWRD
jgi:hypothetical protein